MIHWTTLLYVVIAIILVIGIVRDYFSSYYGGLWSGGKRSNAFGVNSYVYGVLLLIFTLIFGGIFWW